jgi:hypothetical protein
MIELARASRRAGVSPPSLLVALLLAVVPYALARGPLSRIVRLFMRREERA